MIGFKRGMYRVTSLMMLVILCSISGCSNDDHTGPGDSGITSTNIALYDDLGSWAGGVNRIQNYLESEGFTIERVNAGDVITGDLQSRFGIVIFPGGNTQGFIDKLQGAGVEILRDFVRSGGGYLGICAGSCFPFDRHIWMGIDYDMPLDLISGYAIGPLPEIAEQGVWTDVSVRFNGNHPASGGLDGVHTVKYCDGPRFETGGAVPFAWYEDIQAPGAVDAVFGQGRVTVVGFHPEMLDSTKIMLKSMVQWVMPAHAQSGNPRSTTRNPILIDHRSSITLKQGRMHRSIR